jgi:hypothetical protein
MKMNWFLPMGVAAVSLMALAACSSSTTGTGGGGTAGGATVGTGGTGGTGTGGTGTGGSSPYTGTNTCNDYITGHNWSKTLTMSDFSSEAAYTAWSDLNTCACVNGTGTGCLNICSQPENTTTTNNFCNGVAALGQCHMCLNGTGTGTGTAVCTTEYTACTSN